MLQISNLDEGKADWINETQLIIPMVDGEELAEKEIEGMEKHTITLNALDGTDQTLLTSVNGHAFVIGLDRALFENYNSKSDFLLMPNSDLKVLPTVSGCRLTYNLPPVDQGKNDIVWENNTFEKPLTKDILNVIQDTSKGWGDLDKNNELCLENIGVNENKISRDFLIDPQLVNQSKKMRSDNAEYVVGYYPLTETCDTVLVPASLMTLPQKPIDAEKGVVIDNDNSKSLLFVTDNIEDTQPERWIKSNLVTHTSTIVTDTISSKGRMPILKTGSAPDNSLLLTHENITKLEETVIPLIDSTNGDFIKTKSKNDIYEMEKCITKEKCDFKGLENENGSLPEQSLPLKKKAKMKNSPVNGNFSSVDNMQGFSMIQSVDGSDEPEQKQTTSNGIGGRASGSDSDEPLSNHAKRKDSSPNNVKKKRKTVNGECKADRTGISEDDHKNRPYKNIMEVLEQLKSEKYINEAVFKILQTGLEEMEVDVLKEMYSKRDTKSSEYSNHVKAFALMIHFKQPTAFFRMGELFESGWPPLSVIKDWKRRLNNRRPKTKSK